VSVRVRCVRKLCLLLFTVVFLVLSLIVCLSILSGFKVLVN